MAPSNGAAFFNPKMSFDRDLSVVMFSSACEVKSASVLDATAGIGARGIRYLLEVRQVDSVLAYDCHRPAAEFCRYNLRLNSLQSRGRVVCADVRRSIPPSEQFDIIDIDPFGSPIEIFKAMTSAVKCRTVMAATATDVATLSGYYPETCLRRYGISVCKTEFDKEVACRVLLASLSRIAEKGSGRLRPLFTYARGHYARTFVIFEVGNASHSNMGYIWYCKSCLERGSSDRPLAHELCTSCGHNLKTIGPVWIGHLSDGQMVKQALSTANCMPYLGSIRTIRRLLSTASDELPSVPTYYVVHEMSRRLHRPTPARSKLIELLKGRGFHASATIFDPMGIRTDADPQVVASQILELASQQAELPLTSPIASK